MCRRQRNVGQDSGCYFLPKMLLTKCIYEIEFHHKRLSEQKPYTVKNKIPLNVYVSLKRVLCIWNWSAAQTHTCNARATKASWLCVLLIKLPLFVKRLFPCVWMRPCCVCTFVVCNVCFRLTDSTAKAYELRAHHTLCNGFVPLCAWRYFMCCMWYMHMIYNI